MITIPSKYKLIGGVVIVVAALAGSAKMGYNYAHKDVAVVQGKLDTANNDLHQRDSVIADYIAATKKAQAEEAAAKKREKEAHEELEKFKKDSQKQDTDFTKGTVEILKKPECVGLKEHLCPAAMGY